MRKLFTIMMMIVLMMFSGCSNDDNLKDPITDSKADFNSINFPVGESESMIQKKRSYIDSVSAMRNQSASKSGFFTGDPSGQFVFEMRNITSLAGNSYSNDIAQQVKNKYSYILDKLINQGTGTLAFGTNSTDKYLNNALKKLRLSETIYWESRKDNTYHSYDLIMNLGPEANNVTLGEAYNLLLNAYSYPGYKLQPVSNAINGGTRLVYGSVTNANNPTTYLVPGGVIEQQAVPGGILNITTTEHTFYKGTVRSVVFKYKNNIFLVTHGEGINRFNNLPNNFVNAVLFNKFSKLNDTKGPLAFKSLGRQILKALGR